jgi:hypothetical protein
VQRGTTARAFATCALISASSVVAPAAHAEDGPQPAPVAASAESLLREGRRLLAEGKLGEACGSLFAGHRLAPTAATALEAGDCFDKAGKTASARAAFDEARALAKQSSDEAELRMKALDDRQPKVILEVPGGHAPPGTSLRLDGVPLDPSAVGTPLPLEPGPHLLTVTRGGSTWTRRIQVETSGSTRIELPGSEADPEAPPVPAPDSDSASPAPAPAPPPSAPGPRIHWEAHRVSGVVVGAAGAVALVAGTVFGGLAISKKSASNDGPCNAADYCNADGRALRADAIRDGNVATASLFAGGAAVASGLALFFTAPPPPTASTGSGFTVRLAAGPGAVRLLGRW